MYDDDPNGLAPGQQPGAIPPIDPLVSGNPDTHWVPPWLAQPQADPQNDQQQAPQAGAAPFAAPGEIQMPDEYVGNSPAAQATPQAPWSIAPDVHPDAIVNAPPPWLAQAQHDQAAPKLGAVDYALSQELNEPTSTGEDPAKALHSIATDPQASLSDRQLAWRQMSPEDRTNFVNTADPQQLAQLATSAMSQEELATVQIRHQQAQIHEQSAQTLGHAVVADQEARRNFATYQQAIQNANEQTSQIEADAKKIAADSKVDPNEHGVLGFLANVLLSGIGGAMSQFTGGRNLALEELEKKTQRRIDAQKADIANRWQGLGIKRNLIAENFARSGDLYHASEVYRISQYDRAISELQTQMQDYDPQGTTALRHAEAIQQIQAQRGAALQATNQVLIKNHLDALKAQNESDTLKESIREHNQTTSLGWANYGREKNDALAKNQIERDKLAEQKATREATQGQAQQEKDIKEIVNDPATGAPLLAPQGQALMDQAKQLEQQATQSSDPAQQQKLQGQAQQLRATATQQYAVRRGDPSEHKDLQDQLVATQNFSAVVDDIKQSIANPSLDSTDRSAWASIGAKYEAAKAQYIKTLGGKVTSREMDAIGKTFAGDPTSVLSRAVDRNKMIASLDAIQDITASQAATAQHGAGGQAPKGGSVWTPKRTHVEAIEPLSDPTSAEAGSDARLGKVGQSLSFTTNDYRQDKAENSSAFGPTGLSKANTATVDKLVKGYSASKDPEKRERIANQLAAYASSPRETIANGVTGLVRNDPAAYKAMLDAPTLNPDLRASLQQQDELHDKLQSQLADPKATLTPEQIDAALANMTPEQRARLDQYVAHIKAGQGDSVMGQFLQRGSDAPVWANDADLDQMLTSGYQPVDVGTAGAAATKEDRGQGGISGAVTAGLSSLASGATAGLSDAAIAALATEGTRKDVAAAREAHPIISTGSNIIGAVAPALLSGGATAPESLGALGTEGMSLAGLAEAAPVNLISRAGGAVSEAVGGGLGGRVLGGAAEGALFGAGQGISDLALSNDPLTAENIAGHISSSALLGAGIGGGLSLLSKGVESALDRAGSAIKEAGAAKAALASVPEDLAQLDEKGLKDALKVATVEHEASKQAEVDALEGVRAGQRKDLVKDIDTLHEDMRSSKLYQAINDDFANGAKPEAIDGITVAQKQIAQANSQIGRFKLNPIGLADNPTKILDGLQKQQSALETIQAKLPQLRTALADNSAGAGLDFVDQALDRTRAQIDAVKALDSKLTPVNSPKLQLLKAGPSERIEQIQAAQQALKDGKTLGLVGSKVQSIAKTAATGIGFVVGGHLPGGHLVGAAAGNWLGERASGAVGWMARKLSGTATKAAEATAGHVDTFLSSASRVGKALKAPAVATATKVLGDVRFSATEEKPKSSDLRDVFSARRKELTQQTVYAPDGSVQVTSQARQQIASMYDGLRIIAPVLADKLETLSVAKLAYLSSKLPRKPDSTELVFGPDKWAPSDHEIRAWANTVRAVEDPASVEERLAHGVMTPEEADAYRTVYPERFKTLQQKIIEAAPTLSKTLPMQKKIALSIFVGVPLVQALQPNVLSVIQGTFAVEPGTAGGTQSPRAEPQFGSHGTPRDIDKPTPAQAREAGGI